MTTTVSDSIKALIEGVELLDQEEAPVSSREIVGIVSPERLAIWATREDISDSLPQETVIAVRCVGSDGESIVEHAVVVNKDHTSAKAIMIECKVSYEEMSPSALVEYQYQDDASTDNQHPWRLSLVSLPYLLSFRAGKFKMWEQRMLQPTCKAEFRRMYAIGPVYQIFDHIMFPSPPEESCQFDVVDDTSGKTIRLPRPVSALRIWNATTQSYDIVDPTLDGTPTTERDRDMYWKDLVNKLKETLGEDMEDMLPPPQQPPQK
mmetsp:Transcript_2604/g.3794  ORF Transcript_2604/g.3794 Transcript_2604/m.3794 type:complete len:263 (-) Transcript_2604:236-1024(-)